MLSCLLIIIFTIVTEIELSSGIIKFYNNVIIHYLYCSYIIVTHTSHVNCPYI